MASVPYVIRAYEPADFEALWRLDQTCFAPGIAYSRRELLTYIGRRSAFTLIAQRSEGNARILHNGEAIGGFITADVGRAQSGHIITIDVAQSARRGGVGSALLSAAEDRLRDAGCAEVRLETAVDNVGALAFYKRRGYFLMRTMPQYYANGVDAFVLKKALRRSSGGE